VLSDPPGGIEEGAPLPPQTITGNPKETIMRSDSDEAVADAMADAAKALTDGLVSQITPYSSQGARDRAWTGGPTNVVDGLYAIAYAVERLADVLEAQQ
jgi:hypothetical protein